MQSKRVEMPKKAKYELHLINDDYNTYEFVCHVLESVLMISSMQAGQVASLAHERGHCKILSGTESRLHEMAIYFKEQGLNVEIKVVNSK